MKARKRQPSAAVSQRRRMLTSMLILVAVIGVFVVKLIDIQVVRADELNTEAVERRSSVIATYGERGDIVDANGALLATSVMRYDIVASPKNAGDFEREVKVARVLGRGNNVVAQERGRL